MLTTITRRTWRPRHSGPFFGGRIHQYAYIREVTLQVDAADPAERRLAFRVFERPVPNVPTDPFEQLAAERGLRASVERVSLAPRDLAAPPDEAERCYLVTLAGPEGGTVARLAFVTSLLDPRSPALRDALWWLAGDAWAVERSGGDPVRWAAACGLTGAEDVAASEFEHYTAQTRALATALGDDAYRQLLAAYQAELMRGNAALDAVVRTRGGGEPRP